MVLISKRLILLFILLTVFFIPDSFASQSHNNYGNIGLTNAETGFNPLAFASYTPSNHNVSSPFSCVIGVDVEFAPVVEDLDNDGNEEIIIVTNSDEVRIYDFSCGLIQIIGFGEDINSMPVLINVDVTVDFSTEFIDIVVLGDSVIKWYEWSESLGKVVLISSIPTGKINEFGLSCGFASDEEEFAGSVKCLTVSTSLNITRYNLRNGSSASFQVATGGDSISPPVDFQSYAIAKFSSNPVMFDIAVVEKDFVSGFRSEIISFDGNITSCEHTTVVSTSKLEFHEELASFGSSVADHLFVSGHFTSSGAARRFFSICNVAGTQKLASGFATQGNITNWAVADFDGNGLVEACLIYHNSSTNSAHVGCWDSTYLRIFDEEINVSNNYRGFALADFDDSNDHMEFITNAGIFRYDVASDDFKLIINISGSVADGDGAIIVTESDTSRVNFGIYTESARIVIFGFLAQVEVACGDGVCSGGENAFNCAVDCLINLTEEAIEGLIDNGNSCVNNSQCISGKCLMKFCTIKNRGEGCDFDRECSSGECDSNGKCTKISLWDGIDTGKTETFGDDTNTNNFIAIATMLLVLFAIMGGGSGNIISGVMGYIAFFVTGMFFTIVGWLSAWIFIILLVMGIAGVVLIILLKTAGE